MANYAYSLVFMFVTICFLIRLCKAAAAADRNQLSFNESISTNGGETLVSPNQRFELGFFSPTTSSSSSTNNNNKSYYYLGIWYKNYPDVVVWVANREIPLTDSNGGTLTIYTDGNLVLLNSSNNIVWSSSNSKLSFSSTNSTPLQISSSVVHLLDSGNLVLTQNRASVSAGGSYLWQSFDYPGDTLLPGMKIGWDWTTGKARKLTSWVDITDPSPGNFVYEMDLLGGLPQLVLREGAEKKFRSGIWNGIRLSGIHRPEPTNPLSNYKYTNSSKEVSFSYEFALNQMITRLVLNQSGILQRYAIQGERSNWSLVYAKPADICDEYAKCGPNGVCKSNDDLSCECLHGFVPKSASEWNVLDRTSGCVRRTPLDCSKRDGFLWIDNVKLPDLLAREFWLNASMSLKECEQMCFRNCSCMAYTNIDIRGKGSGCLIWYGDLIDIKKLSTVAGSEHGKIYIRLSASELNHNQKKMVVMISVLSAVLCLLFIGLLVWYRIRTLKKRREKDKEDIDLPLYDLATLASATNHFSDASVIGTGGFGPVYKGKLSCGQEIAVKRLSKDSGQGIEEFKNEIILISKLQHRNLVRILGWCLEGKEKLLVYEYMPNQSLDNFIFDCKRTILKWKHRFEIAMGIAKGLVYLHQDSRLRIIHRDLKASNVLLDNELNPKISDFGIARIFGGEQNEAKTKIVIGTYGYMSPEYIIGGKFSAKSDVYSYGVLLLELVCGLKNTKYRNTEQYHNLLGHAWLLWNEGRAVEIMDKCLEDSYVESEVERCIQISLLCVQRSPKDRPTMSSVVSMLGNADVVIPKPKKPGFFIEQIQAETLTEFTSGNQLTVTTLDAR